MLYKRQQLKIVASYPSKFDNAVAVLYTRVITKLRHKYRVAQKSKPQSFVHIFAKY